MQIFQQQLGNLWNYAVSRIISTSSPLEEPYTEAVESNSNLTSPVIQSTQSRNKPNSVPVPEHKKKRKLPLPFDQEQSLYTTKVLCTPKNRQPQVNSPRAAAHSTPSLAQAIESSPSPRKLTLNRLYPLLTTSTISSEHILLHLPRAYRYFFKYYEIDTIGKLCSLPIEQVGEKFPGPDAVSTLIQALIKYEERSRQKAAAQARKLYCSPLKVAPVSRGTLLTDNARLKAGSPSQPEGNSSEHWSPKTKLLRHLEKAEYYLSQFQDTTSLDEPMLKFIAARTANLQAMSSKLCPPQV